MWGKIWGLSPPPKTLMSAAYVFHHIYAVSSPYLEQRENETASQVLVQFVIKLHSVGSREQ